MNMLQHVQQAFQEHLLTGSENIAESIVSTDKVPARLRLGIYREAYCARLIEAMSQNFPATCAFLGDTGFESLASAFIAKNPSTWRSIRWYGKGFEDFLMAHNPRAAEIAALDQAHAHAFDAGDAPTLSADVIGRIAPEDWPFLRFIPHPSLKLVRCMLNTLPTWQAMYDHAPAPDAAEGTEPTTIAVWRTELTNRYASLPADEAYALGSVMKNRTFADICEGLCQWHTEDAVAIRAATLLRGWISLGLLTRVENDE